MNDLFLSQNKETPRTSGSRIGNILYFDTVSRRPRDSSVMLAAPPTKQKSEKTFAISFQLGRIS